MATKEIEGVEEKPIHEPTDPRGLDSRYGLESREPDRGGSGGGGLLRMLDHAVESVAESLAPSPLTRRVAVPDFVGRRMSQTFSIADRSGVRVLVEQLSADPAPVDGLVVTQEPPPGAKVKRRSVVRLGVVHELEERKSLR